MTEKNQSTSELLTRPQEIIEEGVEKYIRGPLPISFYQSAYIRENDNSYILGDNQQIPITEYTPDQLPTNLRFGPLLLIVDNNSNREEIESKRIRREEIINDGINHFNYWSSYFDEIGVRIPESRIKWILREQSDVRQLWEPMIIVDKVSGTNIRDAINDNDEITASRATEIAVNLISRHCRYLDDQIERGLPYWSDFSLRQFMIGETVTMFDLDLLFIKKGSVRTILNQAESKMDHYDYEKYGYKQLQNELQNLLTHPLSDETQMQLQKLLNHLNAKLNQ